MPDIQSIKGNKPALLNPVKKERKNIYFKGNSESTDRVDLGKKTDRSNSRTLGQLGRDLIKPITVIKDRIFPRESKLTNQEIISKSRKVTAEAYDQLGIPEDLRPTLQIDDELRFLSSEEIERMVEKKVSESSYSATKTYDQEEVNGIKVFTEGETPDQFTSEQILEKAKEALRKKYEKMGISDYSNLRYFSLGSKDYLGGSYSSYRHLTRVHANVFRTGVYSYEEALAHEAKHTEQALLRASISDAGRAQIIADEFENSIIRGETEEIILRSNFLGPDMMKPPKMSPKMRYCIAKLARDEIYPNAEVYSNDFYYAYRSAVRKVYKELSGDQIPLREFYPAYADKSAKLKSLEKRLGQIADEFPEFIDQYQSGRKEAIDHLMQYMESHSRRYYYLSVPEIKKAEIIDKVRNSGIFNHRHDEAARSLRDYIQTIDGNARNTGIGKSLFGSDRASLDQYQFSPEEVAARNFAAEFEIKKIKNRLKQDGIDRAEQASLKYRLAELELEVQRNNAGKQYYDAYTRHINDPDNAALKAELERLREAYSPLEEKYNERIKKIDLLRNKIKNRQKYCYD